MNEIDFGEPVGKEFGAENKWTCQMICMGILDMKNGNGDHLHTFQSLDNDGSLIQIIEGNDFCKVGDKVRLTLVKIP